MKYFFLLIAGFSILWAGCSIPPAEVALPSPTESPLPTQTASPTAPATAAVTPSPSPGASGVLEGGPLCLPVRAQETLAQVSFDALPEEVGAFLNRGGSLAALDQTLYEQEMANQPAAVASGDLTGNGKLDIVVSVYDARIPAFPPPGMLLIYTCQAGRYQLSYTDSPLEFAGAPIIRELQDLNADGSDELITSSSYCGAHTCFEELKLLSWNGREFENLLPETVRDLPYPYMELVQQQNSQFTDIQITSSGFGSVGAGPQRDLTLTFSYNQEDGDWQQTGEELGSSNYRIHILHDAERAAGRGDYSEALQLYQRVISDTTLDDWAEPEEEQALLAAYARYKMLVLYHWLEQQNFAEVTISEMEALYPPADPQYAFAELASVFHETAQAEGVEEACRTARLYVANGQEDILEGLGASAFGYANPEFTEENLCPEL